jgi:hypothetical protein
LSTRCLHPCGDAALASTCVDDTVTETERPSRELSAFDRLHRRFNPCFRRWIRNTTHLRAISPRISSSIPSDTVQGPPRLPDKEKLRLRERRRYSNRAQQTSCSLRKRRPPQQILYAISSPLRRRLVGRSDMSFVVQWPQSDTIAVASALPASRYAQPESGRVGMAFRLRCPRVALKWIASIRYMGGLNTFREKP